MKNILIIEDSKIINNVINKELVKLDFKADQAFTLSQARGLLIENKYHLIILDLHLPDGEGSELIANIQSLTKTKVIVLTSSQDTSLREELFQYGILDYIIKDKNLLYSISEIVKVINSIDYKVKDEILIIDDSKFICKQIKTILEPRNYIVKSAYTGKSALNKLEKKEFNLIILDMELPDIHGTKVLQEIRKNPNLLEIPILVLSGTSTPEIIRTVLKNGANDFLMKPFVFEEFILKVDLWINYIKKEKEIEAKNLELKYINDNLEKLVAKEIEKNRQKDHLMFSRSRFAQMGEMINMIAHQWRQPLNIIGAISSVINQKIKKNTLDIKTSTDLSKKITEHIEYLSLTIDDFRDFFKPDKKMVKTDFKKIVDKSLVLVKDFINSEDIDLKVIEHEVVEFVSYENELIQVVLNILKNAQDAIVQNNIQNSKINIEIIGIILKISDNGGGIAKDIADKIYDPYFSTKLGKDGTGLGLYMSKVIINEHCNGILDMKNINNGACFMIKLKHDGKKYA